ncbi:MAG: hypothetical protein J7K40_09445 [candidate division Zixibacteria bacterium]|nr:hypothetical protein [candidate division Zixibacteria bacterium]
MAYVFEDEEPTDRYVFEDEPPPEQEPVVTSGRYVFEDEEPVDVVPAEPEPAVTSGRFVFEDLPTVEPEPEEGRTFAGALKDAGVTVGAFAKTLSRIPENLAAKTISAVQGQAGASVVDRGIADRFVNWVDDRNRKLAEQYMDAGDFIPGLISKRDVAELGPNLGFSGVSMAGTLGAGALASPVPIPGARIAAGMAGGAAAAHRMDTYQVMNEWLEKVNQESIDKGLGPISKAEEEKFKKDMSALATEHGAWEAGPEGLGNILELALLTAKNLPGAKWLPKKLTGKLVKGGLRAAGLAATEVATETPTLIGQQRVEAKAGMTDEVPLEWTSGKDILKSAKKVLPQVLLLAGFMSAGGAAYRKATGEAPPAAPIEPPVEPPAPAPMDAAVIGKIGESLKAGKITPEEARNLIKRPRMEHLAPQVEELIKVLPTPPKDAIVAEIPEGERPMTEKPDEIKKRSILKKLDDGGTELYKLSKPDFKLVFKDTGGDETTAWMHRRWVEKGKPDGKKGTELIEYYDKYGVLDGNRRIIIEQAISEGKTIPPEVLKEYPEYSKDKATVDKIVKAVEEGRITPEQARGIVKQPDMAHLAPQIEELIKAPSVVSMTIKENTKLREQVKDTIKTSLKDGGIKQNAPVRFTTVAELDDVLKKGELTVGKDFEGQPGISAQRVYDDSVISAYGSNEQKPVAIVFPESAVESKGQSVDEVKMKATTKLQDLKFIVDGKLQTYDELTGTKAAPEREGREEGTATEISKPDTSVPEFKSSEEALRFGKIATKRVTDSPNFVKWFGNSKVVDDDGAPLVVYHGTNAVFDTFKEGLDGGIWFTNKKDVAKDFIFIKGFGREIVKKAYLSLKNPYIHDMNGRFLQDSQEVVNNIKELNNELGRNYDGIILKNTLDYVDKEIVSDIYIAFNPTQIKLVGPSAATEKVISELKKKGFDGTVDRLNRGEITLDQAKSELNGDKSSVKINDEPLPEGAFGRSWDEIQKMQGGGLKKPRTYADKMAPSAVPVKRKTIMTEAQKKARHKKKVIKEKQLNIDSAKEAKDAVHSMIRDRRHSLNLSSYETNLFVNDLGKVTTKEQREIIPFIIEGTNVPKGLNRPDLEKVLKRDKKVLTQIAAQVRQHFKNSWEKTQELASGMSAQETENYVTHIWDIPKKRRREVTNWFITKSRFKKRRFIDTIAAGVDELGLKPKVLDIGEIIKIHDSVANRAIENAKFVEDLYNLKKDGVSLIERMDTAPQDWVLMNHPALTKTVFIPGESKMGEKVTPELQNILAEMGVAIGHRIGRGDAAGLYKTGDPPEMRFKRFMPSRTIAHEIGHHIDLALGLGESFLQRHKTELYALNKNRIEKSDFDPEYTGSTEEQIAEAFAFLFTDPKTMRRVAPTAMADMLSKMKQDGKISKLIDFDFETKSKNLVEEQLNTLSKLPVKVHPDLAGPLGVIFDSRFDRPAIAAYEAISGLLKKTCLSVSLFHHVALGEAGMVVMNPLKVLSIYLNPIKIYKAVAHGELDVYKNTDLAREAIRNGVQLGATNDIPVQKIQGYLDDFAAKTRNVFVVNKAAKFVQTFNKKWDVALWDYLHDTLKLYAYESLSSKIKTEKNRVKKKEEIGQFINDTFGGQNWETLMVNPKTVQMMTWGLLSADWTVSTIRQALAFTGFGAVHKETRAMRMKLGSIFWLKAGLYYGVGINLLNAVFRAVDQEENPEYYKDVEDDILSKSMFGNALGHKTHLFVGRYEDGTERYIRWGKQFRELPEMLFDDAGFSPVSASIKKIGGKANPLLQLTSQIATGHSLSQFKNDDIYGKKGWDFTYGIAKTIMKSPLPFSSRSLFTPGKEFHITDVAMPSSKGMSRYKTMSLFKTAIIKKDERLLKEVYQDALMNNLPAYTLFNAALTMLKAEETKEYNRIVKDIKDIKELSLPEAKALDRRLKRTKKERVEKMAGIKLLEIAIAKMEIHIND